MIVLYGAGHEFIKIVKENKYINFDFVVDTYPQNYPQGVCGYAIHDKSKLSDLADTHFACITSTKWFDDIFQIIRTINNVVTIIDFAPA